MQNKSKPITVETPSLKRRLICLVYELFLLTAVVMFALFVFLFVTQKLQGPVQEYGRQIVLFLAAGAYFIHSWTGSGHTLAMKTWRIKLVKVGHARVPFGTAVLRYVLAWGWVLPALVVSWTFGLHSKAQIGTAVAVNVVLWAMTALLDKNGQFLHDRLAGTRLILLPKAAKTTAKTRAAAKAG